MTCAVAVDTSGLRRESVPPVLKRSTSACLAGRHVIRRNSFHGISANSIPADLVDALSRWTLSPIPWRGIFGHVEGGERKNGPTLSARPMTPAQAANAQ
jgi:hypothetical protein